MMFGIYIVTALALTSIGADVIETITIQDHGPKAVPGQGNSAVSGSKTETALGQNTQPSPELNLNYFPVKDSDSSSRVKLADDGKSRSLLQLPEDGPAVRTVDINGVESAFTPTQEKGFPNPGFRNNFTRPDRGVAAQIFNRFSRGSARHISKSKDQNQQDINKNHDSAKHMAKDEIEILKPSLSPKSNIQNPVKRETEYLTSNIQSKNEQANKKVAFINTQIPFSFEDHEVTIKRSDPVVFKQGRQLWTILEPTPLKFYNFHPYFYPLQGLFQIHKPLHTFKPTFIELIDHYVPLNNVKLQQSDNNIPNSLPENSSPLSIYLPSIPLHTIPFQSVSDSVPSNTVTLKSAANTLPMTTVSLQSVSNSIPLQSADNSIPLHTVPSMTDVNIQHQSDDKLGNYEYGYSNSLSAKYEARSLDGVTRGAYSYVDPYGAVQSVNYEADNLNGFRVMATNLPLAPKL